MEGDEEKSLGGSHVVVLLHTLPEGNHGVRAEEAAYRQYNSCVDFTFQDGLASSNARKLKRLNVIFERAADRHSGGIREDKLLRLLPPGTATKFGLDPAAVKKRLQLRREQAAAEEKDRSKRKEKKRGDHEVASNGDEVENGITDNANDLRVLSRGTFLAMFANEPSTFINSIGQNEKADRERKAMRSNKHGNSTKGSNGSKKRESRHAPERKERAKYGFGGSKQVAPPTAPRSSSPHSAPGNFMSSKDRKSRRALKRTKSIRSSRSGRRSHRRKGSRKGRGKEDGTKGNICTKHANPSQSRSRARSRSKLRERVCAQHHRRAASEGNFDDDGNRMASGGRHRRHSFDALPDMRDVLGIGSAAAEDSTEGNQEYFTVLEPNERASDFDGHSADEAGGGSNSKSGFSVVESEQAKLCLTTEQKRRTGAKEKLSQEDRVALRRERRKLKEEAKRKLKEEAQRLQLERELVKSEEKKRILEEAETKNSDDMNLTTKEECAFLSSVVKVFKKLFPGPVSKRGAVIGVAPGRAMFVDRRMMAFSHRESYSLARDRGVPVPFQHYSHLTANPWYVPGNGQGHAPIRASNPTMRSFSYSSNDSLVGECMLPKTATSPQVAAATRLTQVGR